MKKQTSQSKKEKGAVMIEAAITMPIILMLLTATYDIGNALNAVFRVQDFARMGINQLSSQLDLEPGTFQSTSSGCRMLSPTNGPCSSLSDHPTVHAMVRNMITRARDLNIDPNSIVVETTFLTPPLNPVDIVSIKISGRYTGMFFPFNNLPISLAETGPKL